MKVAVTGATGFIGRALCKKLAQQHNLVALTRNPEKAYALLGKEVEIVKWNPNSLDGWEKGLENSEAIINLAGTNLASGRWTKDLKTKILNSRINASRTLIQAVKELQAKPKVVITASAIGFYGNRGDETLGEESAGGDGFLASITQKVEDCSKEFETLGLRSIVIRTGIVLGESGGALPKMITPIKFYLGGYLGSGNQWMSWISLTDEVAAIKFLIENNDLHGVFNLTSPEPLTNRQFFKLLSSELKKPCWLPIPALALKIGFGQMATELFLISQRVYPNKLLEAGFKFQDPELKNALASIGFAGNK